MRRTRRPLTEADLQAVRDFERFLSGELAIRKSTGECVDPALVGTDPDIVMAGQSEADGPDETQR